MVKYCKIKYLKVTKEHNLNYEEHNYYSNKKMIEDYNNDSIKILKRKMTNYNYLINIIKYEVVKNEIKDTNGELLYDFIKKI